MIATVVNTITVLIGSIIGLLIKKGIPDRLVDALMKGIGLCTLFIGISGALSGENTIILVISMAIGILIGEGFDLDDRLNRFVQKIEDKFHKLEGNVSVTEGFITACLMFCVGAMTIVGSLQAGLTGDCEMIYTKAVLDLISSMILAASLGIGVIFAAGFVLVFQGAITLFAGVLSPVLSTTVINEMTCVGSVLIIALGLNLLGITKLKVLNYIPAIFIPIILVPAASYLATWF